MTSLREEIKERIGAMFDKYGNFDDSLDDSTDDIFRLFEKRIDSIMQREISDSHHFEIQRLKNDLSTTDAIVRICRELKEMLK